MKNRLLLGLLLFLGISFSFSQRIDKTYLDEQNYNKSYTNDDNNVGYQGNADSFYKSYGVDPNEGLGVVQSMAEFYYDSKNYINAVKWYALFFKRVSFNNKINPKHYKNYSYSLAKVGKITEAKMVWSKYLELVNKDVLRKYLNKLSLLGKYKFSVRRSEMNSDFGSEFAPFFLSDDLVVFTASYDSLNVNTRKNKNQSKESKSSSLDIYIGEYDSGRIVSFEKMSGDVNTQNAESRAVFNKNGDVMFFTRSLPIKIQQTSSIHKNVVTTKLFKAEFKKGKWVNIQPISISGTERYSTLHPALSNDEKKLYFVSDAPDGFGGMDIYYVNLDSNFQPVGNPVNVGSRINTIGDEAFPFISDSQDFYFSSNGHKINYGGMDIYVSCNKDKGFGREYGTPQNIGFPVNSEKNDFGFSISEKMGVGFFSSDREGTIDIYDFTLIGDPYLQPESTERKNLIKDELSFIEINTKNPSKILKINSTDNNPKLSTISFYDNNDNIQKNSNINSYDINNLKSFISEIESYDSKEYDDAYSSHIDFYPKKKNLKNKVIL